MSCKEITYHSGAYPKDAAKHKVSKRKKYISVAAGLGAISLFIWMKVFHAVVNGMMQAEMWHNIWQERRQLRELDERMLKDIGITADEARRESSRPFWDYD